MPKSKRNKQIELAKTKKRGLEWKKHLLEEVRSSVDKYANVFLFSVNDMRNSKMKYVREQWKHSRFFIGKNKIMAMALGRLDNEEYKPNLHKLGQQVKGQCGLLFSNKSVEDVLSWFRSYSEGDFARSGNIATEDVHLNAGPLPMFPHNLEPYLRQLGLPTSLVKGVIHLIKDHEVCKVGDVLTPQTAKILKLLGYEMAEFHITIDCVWSHDGSFMQISDRVDNSKDKERIKKKKTISSNANLIQDDEEMEVEFKEDHTSDNSDIENNNSVIDNNNTHQVENKKLHVQDNDDLNLQELDDSDKEEPNDSDKEELNHSDKEELNHSDKEELNHSDLKGDENNVRDKKITDTNEFVDRAVSHNESAANVEVKIDEKSINVEVAVNDNESLKNEAINENKSATTDEHIISLNVKKSDNENILSDVSTDTRKHESILTEKDIDDVELSDTEDAAITNEPIEADEIIDTNKSIYIEEGTKVSESTKIRASTSKRKLDVSDFKTPDSRQGRSKTRGSVASKPKKVSLSKTPDLDTSQESPVFRELRNRSVRFSAKKKK